MYTPLEALYTYATERGDLTHWFFNQDLADTYARTLELAETQSGRLSEDLSPDHASRFKKCMDNTRDSLRLESELLFYQGLAMGLQLGSMVCLV